MHYKVSLERSLNQLINEHELSITILILLWENVRLWIYLAWSEWTTKYCPSFIVNTNACTYKQCLLWHGIRTPEHWLAPAWHWLIDGKGPWYEEVPRIWSQGHPRFYPVVWKKPPKIKYSWINIWNLINRYKVGQNIHGIFVTHF